MESWARFVGRSLLVPGMTEIARFSTPFRPLHLALVSGISSDLAGNKFGDGGLIQWLPSQAK